MSGLGKVVRSGVRRRKVQTLVTGLAAMMAVTASVLGGSLLVASNGPFDQAFARQHGAHLTAQFDAGRTTAAQLSASGHAAGVTAASGPFRTATVNPHDGSDAELPAGMSLRPRRPRRTRRRHHAAPGNVGVQPWPGRAIHHLRQPRQAGGRDPAVP
jgi:putative ABC transport system permease protein